MGEKGDRVVVKTTTVSLGAWRAVVFASLATRRSVRKSCALRVQTRNIEVISG